MKKISSNDIVYLSGPITGYPNGNAESFHFAEEHLTMRFGCTVLNPARNPPGLTYAKYMQLAMDMIDRATAVVVIPGGHESTGSRIEQVVAKIDKKPVFLFNVPELIHLEG